MGSSSRDASHSARSVGFTAYNSACRWESVQRPPQLAVGIWLVQALRASMAAGSTFSPSSSCVGSVLFLPASGPPKITWFKVGKKNQIAKNQTKVWGFSEKLRIHPNFQLVYIKIIKGISGCTWTAWCLFPFTSCWICLNQPASWLCKRNLKPKPLGRGASAPDQTLWFGGETLRRLWRLWFHQSVTRSNRIWTSCCSQHTNTTWQWPSITPSYRAAYFRLGHSPSSPNPLRCLLLQFHRSSQSSMPLARPRKSCLSGRHHTSSVSLQTAPCSPCMSPNRKEAPATHLAGWHHHRPCHRHSTWKKPGLLLVSFQVVLKNPCPWAVWSLPYDPACLTCLCHRTGVVSPTCSDERSPPLQLLSVSPLPGQRESARNGLKPARSGAKGQHGRVPAPRPRPPRQAWDAARPARKATDRWLRSQKPWHQSALKGPISSWQSWKNPCKWYSLGYMIAGLDREIRLCLDSSSTRRRPLWHLLSIFEHRTWEANGRSLQI